MTLSIIIPAFNEEKRIVRAVRACFGYLHKRRIDGEVLVVDDGSKDKTTKHVQRLQHIYPELRLDSYQPNKGKGWAVKQGMLKSRGTLRAFTDADLSTPIEELDKLIDSIHRGADIAIASRGLAQSHVVQHQSWIREQFGKLFGSLTRLFVLRGIRDTQCGCKMFTKRAATSLFRKQFTPSPIWDVEILVLAARAKFIIAEVPVVWHHDPVTRLPYTMRRSLVIFWELLQIKWRRRILWPITVKTQ